MGLTSEGSTWVNIDRVRQAGSRGFIGLLLMLIGAFIPDVGVVVQIVGLVLLLLALSALSQELQEPKIFRYAIYAVVIDIVGAVIIVFTVGAYIFAMLGVSIFTAVGRMPALPFGASAFIGALIGTLIAFYVLMVVVGYLYRKIYEMLSERVAPLSQGASDDFRSASKWYWLGSLLLIILVGAILLLIAIIKAMMGFHNLERASPPAQPGSPTATL